MSVKHVGVRELRGDLAEKLKGSEPIVIERHGQVLGIYVPVQQVDRAKAAEALEQFHALIDRIVRETDITREELAEAFMAERDDRENGSDD
ncbi:MAG: prevent-host-death protein [Chloroflexota bacterium]|nr:prevent-host-death protein [Chloroflexota bacterium]